MPSSFWAGLGQVEVFPLHGYVVVPYHHDEDRVRSVTAGRLFFQLHIPVGWLQKLQPPGTVRIDFTDSLDLPDWIDHG
ncbi:MAG: hypothetical protein RH862_02405 [Leptospiraceae bacterium]